MMPMQDTPQRPARSRNQMLVETISRLFRKQAYAPLQKIFAKTFPVDLAQIIDTFPEDEVTKLFAQMPSHELGARVLQELSHACQGIILRESEEVFILLVLEKMAPDVRTDIFSRLEPDLANHLLAGLGRDSKREVENLLQYDPKSAGGIMTSQFFALPEETLVADAIAAVRKLPYYEMVFYLYVVDARNRLVGVSSLRQLILADPGKTLAQMMNPRVLKVYTHDPQEKVAEQVRRHRLLGIPVVNEEEGLVGLVTVDDLIHILEDEVTDDMLKMVGSSGEEFLTQSPFKIVKLRIPWLMAAFVGGVGAAGVVDAYEETLSKVIQLSAFLPIVMGMAGNVGTQAATIAVRSLATGAIQVSNFYALVFKEINVGVLLGSFIGVCLATAAYFMFHQPTLSLTVGVSIMMNIVIAALIASSLPLAFQRLGADPALASGPFVLTSIDVLGVINYMVMASLIYGI